MRLLHKSSKIKLPKIKSSKITSFLLLPVSLCLVGLPVQVVVSDVAQAQTLLNRRAEADRLLQRGTEQFNTSQFEAAIQSWQQALSIYREIKDREGEGWTLGGLGIAYDSLGKYDKAIEYHLQSLAIARELKDRQSEGKALGNLGLTYNSLGKYDKAIECHQQLLQIAREIKYRRGEGAALGNLGLAYYSLGKYDKAIEFHLQSLEIARELKNRRGESIILGNLGLAYNSLGKYDKAIEFHLQRLVIAREIKDRQGEGKALGNLGLAYKNLGKYDQAIAYHQQHLAIAQKIKDRQGEGEALGNLGSIYDLLGKYDQAITYHLQNLAIARQIKDRQGEGVALNNLAVTYGKLGRDREAIFFYQQALAIAREVNDRNSEGYILANLGIVLNRIKQVELAILFYKQSVNIREAMRQDVRNLDRDIQKSYLATVEKTYRSLADLLLQQDRILEAQQVLDLLKVQELNDYLRTPTRSAKTEQGLDLQRPEQNIIALANELNQLQQKDRNGKLSASEQERLAQLVQAERDQNKQFNAFLDTPQIKKLIAELRRNEDNQNIDIAKYRKLQKDLLAQFPNAVLLYPLILDDRLELVLLSANTPPIRRTVKIKREKLNQLIVEMRADLQDGSNFADIKNSSSKIYDLLIKPFESEFKELKINTIIYAPDGQLRYIPLSALYDGQQWLVEKYRVNNITAESLTAFNTKPITNPRIFAGAFGGKTGENRSGFGGLPASITEVQQISQLFPDTTSFIEQNFTKNITEARANSHTILHLATHGKLTIGSPEDSFILFGNGDKVTITELKDWQLRNVDIVILSACQSGIGGKLGTGVEVLGLGYQMQTAGARAVIASLWEVADDGTAALMSAFYGELKKGNISTVEALSRAQIALIKSNKFKHPKYWSAFFVIGNGL